MKCTLCLNARPNNNQLILYYLPMCYLLRIQQHPANHTNNTIFNFKPHDVDKFDSLGAVGEC